MNMSVLTTLLGVQWNLVTLPFGFPFNTDIFKLSMALFSAGFFHGIYSGLNGNNVYLAYVDMD